MLMVHNAPLRFLRCGIHKRKPQTWQSLMGAIRNLCAAAIMRNRSHMGRLRGSEAYQGTRGAHVHSNAHPNAAQAFNYEEATADVQPNLMHACIAI